jgi:hypothetical protein
MKRRRRSRSRRAYDNRRIEFQPDEPTIEVGSAESQNPTLEAVNVHRRISVFNAPADEDHWSVLKYHQRLCECHNTGYSADDG